MIDRSITRVGRSLGGVKIYIITLIHHVHERKLCDLMRQITIKKQTDPLSSNPNEIRKIVVMNINDFCNIFRNSQKDFSHLSEMFRPE